MKLTPKRRNNIPQKEKTIPLDGYSLTPQQIYRITHDASVSVVLDATALKRMKQSRDFLLKSARTQAIYGVNTGFGPMVTHIIGVDQIVELQYNLLRGHANGIGDPIENEYVLAAMVVRLNTLIRGTSGVSKELAQTLCACINARILPIVPEHGAVGTSGDLVQLAHIALVVIGEGDVIYKGKRMKASEALNDAHIQAHTLGPKEGLSLINGTSVMSGIASIVLIRAKRALSIAIRTGALSFELVNGFTDVIDPRLHAMRPHPGQEAVARIMRELVRGSKLLSDREKSVRNVPIKSETHVTDVVLQEVYSIRCIPQVLGPIMDTIRHAEDVITTEINSTTDNPVVDVEKGRFLHGGNFHGDYVATAVDQLKAVVIKLTLLSERRINFFLNKNINKIFPPFLNLEVPGLTMGLQGLQFVATSTAANSQSLGYPHSLHTISTNGDNQDIVSMGTDAALFTAKAISNAFVVLSIELVTLQQATQTLNAVDSLSSAGKMLLAGVRKVFKPIVQDRVMTPELEILRTTLVYDESFDLTY
ncbi:MAG TPA: aromatic amino acid ammonia-lyase [Candidatus Paceibacterota bacterium]|nr:aromatic amino acid ammonia-lyase [Candidatus Paceibacterota bacterium]